MNAQLFLGIIVIVFIILLAFLIPVILQVARTAKSVENFLKTTQESLTPLLRELKESVERANKVTVGLEDSVNNVQHLTKAVGEMGSIIDEINHLVRQSGLAFSVKSTSLGVGIKTALSVLAKGIIKGHPTKKEDV